MNRSLALLPVLAAMAVPAAAHADMIHCTDDTYGFETPCELTVNTSDGARFSVPSGKVITSYAASFGDNTRVGLRLMRRNADGTFTSDGSTGYTDVNAGHQTLAANLPVPAGAHTVALDLHNGSVSVTPGAGTILSRDSLFDDGETASAGESVNDDLDLTIGLADAPDPDPTPVDDGGSSHGGHSTDDDGPESKHYKPGLSFDPRAVIDADGKGIEAYARNETGGVLDGTLRLKVGKHLYKTNKVSDFDYSSSSDIGLWFGGKAAKRVLRKGSIKATIVARFGSLHKRFHIRIIRGGARGFDGTYRGKGPITMKVVNGVITGLDEPMNTYCTQTGKFVMRSMMTGLGFPALVKKDGSFSHKASLAEDSFLYKGKLKRHGVSSGYSSLWYSSFDFAPDSGNLRATQCMQAAHWKAKRK